MGKLLTLIIAAIAIAGLYVAYPQSVIAPQTPKTAETSAYAKDYASQGLAHVPRDIFADRSIRQLDLSHNALTGALPAEIRFLADLEVLDISNNAMTGLPAEIGQLSKLRVLNASNNQLTGLPYEIGNLQQLQLLDLSGNDISVQDLEYIKGKLPSTTQIIL